MNFINIFAVTFLSFCLDLCFCQYFTASFEIENLLQEERKLLDSLNIYFKRQENRGLSFDEDTLKFIKLAGQRNREMNRDHAYDNPLTTYTIVKRAVQDWTRIKKNLTCTEDHDHAEECPLLTGADVIHNAMKEDGARWPSEHDLKLAVDSILNVQNVYNISINELKQGKIGAAVVQALNADDIFFIANTAKDSGKTYEAITWFQYLAKHLEEFSSRDFTTGTLHRRLAASYFEHGMPKKATNILEHYSKKDPEDNGVARDLKFLNTRSNKETAAESSVALRFLDRTKKIEERLKYENICRNAVKGIRQLDSRLRCYIRRLYRTYGVSKIEIFATRPRVELVYDVVSTIETDTIQSFGEQSLGKLHSAFSLKESQRASKQSLDSGPLCEGVKKYELLRNVTQRLEEITNFRMYQHGGLVGSECYQVVNEGLGSMQNFVVNAWPKGYFPYPFSGNRVATILIQLSDIQFGGQVVFPRVNVAVPVIKGSAIVLWNLKRDGQPDSKSVHISCPTVVGSNWVAKKHVLYNSQIFRRPCETVR